MHGDKLPKGKRHSGYGNEKWYGKDIQFTQYVGGSSWNQIRRRPRENGTMKHIQIFLEGRDSATGKDLDIITEN